VARSGEGGRHALRGLPADLRTARHSRHDAPGERQIKTLVHVLDGELTPVLLRGDHPLNEQKLIDATGETVKLPLDEVYGRVLDLLGV
jgi:hypothetical protein